jgi:hypothetical protein
MSRAGSNAKPNRAMIALCLISVSLAACGIYLHHRTIDSVIATAWSSRGRPVQLVQEVSFAWSFVGAAPHVVDPHTVRGPLTLVAERHGRTALAGYGDEWDFNWALARSQGRGFVVGISRTRASGNFDSVCLLIDLSGQVTRCPRGVPAAELYVFMGRPKAIGWSFKAVQAAKFTASILLTGHARSSTTPSGRSVSNIRSTRVT